MADHVGEVKYKVGMDDSDLDKQINKSESKIKEKFGNVVKAVGAATAAAVAAGTAAVVKLTKDAVSAYAEFEQLSGGIETLFGAGGKTLEEYADSVGKTTEEVGSEYRQLMKTQNEVMNNAAEAYKTAGLSANEYMETVTSFAASLTSSLGENTDKAASYADQAIRDMSDNANKMGSSMESIQNAYQAFAKGNFTLLDNLKLGYGGTKEEMDRLMRDAEKLAGYSEGAFDKNNFADIVDAIHIIQEDMEITGTTADEAAKTISGSMAMVKASWQNVIEAIGEGDSNKLTKTINELVNTVETAAGNLLPVVETSLQGIASLISKLAPEIAAKLPKMITDAAPGLLKAGGEAIEAFSKGIIESIPQLMPTITDLIMQLVRMIISMAPELITCGVEIIVQLAGGITDALPELIPACTDAILTIADTLTQPDMLAMLIDVALQLILAITEGLIKAMPELMAKGPEIVINLAEAIIKSLPKIMLAGAEMSLSIITGMVQYFGKLIETGAQIVEKVKSGFSQKVQDAKKWGSDMIQNFINGILEKFNALKSAVTNVASTVKNVLGFSEPKEGPLSDFHTYAPDMMDLYAKGIDDNIKTIENSVQHASRAIAETFSADVNYNIPDIAGYAADLAASVTATQSMEIIVPLTVDGREIARATAWYTNEQLAWEAR